MAIDGRLSDCLRAIKLRVTGKPKMKKARPPMIRQAVHVSGLLLALPLAAVPAMAQPAHLIIAFEGRGPLAPLVQSGDAMPGTAKFFSSMICGFEED